MSESQFSSIKMFQFSVKLCAAVKKHECLYAAKTPSIKYEPQEWDAAWLNVAEETGESVETCKWRWQNIRRSFRRSLLRETNQYYLHEYMEFLIPHFLLNEQNDTKTDVKGKMNENDDGKSDSDTSSADETHVLKAVLNKQKLLDEIKNSQTDDNGINTNQVGDFLINEIEEGRANNDEHEHDDNDMNSVANIRSRLRYRRACKRGLEAQMSNELTAEQKQEEKRPRRSADRRKDLSDAGSEEFSRERKSLSNVKKIEVKVNKTKFNKTLSTQLKHVEPQPANEIRTKKTAVTTDYSENSTNDMQTTTNILPGPHFNIITPPVKKPLLVDRSTITDFQTRDSSTQYDASAQEPLDFDDNFINSLKPQLKLMNGRQKMNFKRKVFQSIMEVFDDATNFPNTDEYIVLPPTGAPRFDTTTTGELRLMRELVSLVQAAKTTPEIVNSTDKVTSVIEKPSTPQLPVAKKTSSPMSPNFDDDDLSFTKEVINVDDEPLPRSLDEILDTRNQNDGIGLPRRILHKVVKVAGTNGSTIVTGEGNKRRVYRIYPKTGNSDASRGITTKNSGNIGTFYVTPSKGPNSTLSTPDNNNYPNGSKTTPNFTFRAVNKSGESFVSANAINRSSSNVSFNKTINTPKGVVTPILNQSTGLFAIPYAASKTPSSNNNPNKIQINSAPLITNSNLNNSNMRIVSVKSNTNNSAVVPNQNSIMQRRYSICGPVPVAAPMPISAKPQPKPFIQKITQAANGNSIKSAVSNIMISKPVSLNQASPNTLTNVKTFLATTYKNAPTTTSKITPTTNIDIEKPNATNEKKSASSVTPDTSKPPLPIAQAQIIPDIPILETAGTISADTFTDPLYIKPTIKSEPID